MVQAQTVGQVSQVQQYKMQTFVNELEFERVLKQQLYLVMRDGGWGTGKDEGRV